MKNIQCYKLSKDCFDYNDICYYDEVNEQFCKY